ncbi:MAG TPA: glycine betaine ABC transporter substrate-binding protein [Acidobacteriota bacterium]|nr:glycine betaine ABC transporter substrate-binding protein [Acidobacteriota bacterium]
MIRYLPLIVCLAFYGCAKTDQIVVVSKNFGEQVLLGELLAQHIEKKTGISVQRKLHLGGTFICHEALKSGEADLYVEYTGTALTAILKKAPKTDRDVVYNEVKKAYQDRFDLEWTEPLGFNNTFAIIIRDEEAKRLGIQTISEASRHTPQWKAGFGYEFMERKDGFPGLAAAYGLKFSQPPRVMDLTLTYRAIAEKQVDFIAGNSTDGIISKLKLFVLKDDKHYFPPYDAAPVVRSEVLRRHPQIRTALKELAGKISEEEMRKMNYLVDGEHKDVKVVAADFLKSLEADRAGGSH